MSYIHIKLDKFVAGQEKRLFKSNISQFQSNDILENNQQNIANQNIKNINGIQDVLYGNYHNISGQNNLLNFNEINLNYIKQADQINYNQYINTTSYYNCLFEQNNYNLKQQVQYFKSILQIPIDIAGVEDMAYALSPLGKRKNIQIFSPQFNLLSKNYKIEADYKENYQQMYNYLLNRQTANSQFNTVPLYDLDFSNLQTITFQSLAMLSSWINTYKLNSISSIILCNINNKFEDLGYDSVNLKQLFDYLIENNIQILQKQNIIIDLVKNINQNSFNSYINRLGNVSNINEQLIPRFTNSDIISTSINNIFSVFSKQLPQLYTTNSIPNNSLYLIDTYNKLDSIDNNEKLNATANFVNLKNLQTPLQDFQIQLNQNINLSSSAYNKKIMQLFDNDKTKSYQFNLLSTYNTYISNNNQHLIPTKQITEQIIDKSIEFNNNNYNDQILSTNYLKLDQNNLCEKKQYYLAPFYQRHIEDNKSYEIGELNGLRSYQNIGILDQQDNIWLSYKYITSKSNKLINSFLNQHQLPFKSYQTKRLKQHMQYDFQGIMYQGKNNAKITKIKNVICPYIKFNRQISGCLACSCDIIKNGSYEQECIGYCGFPISGKYIQALNYKVPIFNWNYQTYQIQKQVTINSQFDFNNNLIYFSFGKGKSGKLIADSDIIVNDDIEIYFSNMQIEEFSNYLKQNENLELSAIFEGFSKKYSIKNLSETEKTQIFVDKNIADYMLSIQQYTNKFITVIQKTTLNDLFNRPLISFIDSEFINNIKNKIDIRVFQNNLNNIMSNQNNSQIFSELLSTNYSKIGYDSALINQNICENMSYYKLKYTNFYNIIKQLYIDDNLKIKDLPNIKIKQSDLYIYNNFIVANNTPFNAPHIIKKGTVLSGLKMLKTKDDIKIEKSNNILLEDYSINNGGYETIYCYIKVINWWSNNIKCQGNIKVQYNHEDIEKTKTYQTLLSMINNYDHIEVVDGFFKSLQSDYKKSNIYSIKVKNSYLDPKLDINQNEFYQYILLRNYAFLDKNIQKYYKFMDIKQLQLKQRYNFKDNQFKNTILYKLYEANLNNSTLNIAKDFDNYYLIDLQNNNLNLNNFDKSKMFLYIKNQGGIYYLDKEYLSKVKKAKKDLREIFQTAIKDSVHKYMPVHTDLWKIIYEN